MGSRTVLPMILIGIFKLFTMSLLILGYFFTSGLLQIIFFKNKFQLKRILIKLIGRCCQIVLLLLNIKVDILNKSQAQTPWNALFYVSNHLSYLDILILFAHFPSCFITSKEIKETPFLGTITTMAGCIFVERRNKLKIENEIKEIEEALLHKLNIFVFPEATSTNGDCVKTFKRPLFNAAINTETPVKPLTLNYLKVNNHPLNRQNRDQIFWYGDMLFFSHFIRLIFTRSIHVNIVVSDIIHPFGHDKTSLAFLSNQIVEQAFIPVQ